MKIEVDLEGLKDEELKGKFDEIEQTILELMLFHHLFQSVFKNPLNGLEQMIFVKILINYEQRIVI